MSAPTLVDEPEHTRTYESYTPLSSNENCHRHRSTGETGGGVTLGRRGVPDVTFSGYDGPDGLFV